MQSRQHIEKWSAANVVWNGKALNWLRRV